MSPEISPTLCDSFNDLAASVQLFDRLFYREERPRLRARAKKSGDATPDFPGTENQCFSSSFPSD